MTQIFRLTLIWITGCMLAFVMAMNFLPAALVDGHYIPVSNDSFYHARRILDTVANPAGFYEFDPYIHYPEGSWIVWPWGFDYLMAQIVRASLWILGSREPMAVLAYIPVFAITITIALVVGITTVLRLSMPMRALIVASFGFSALTQTLHGVGVVDHHFAEHIMILATVLLGMLWLRTPHNRWWPIALGLVLGTATAFHNGLFILQVPVLAALILMWLRGTSTSQRSAAFFAAGLMLGTAVAAFPSSALKQGAFEFYLLSWFHVYVSASTALLAILLSRWPVDRRHLISLGCIAVALVIPLGAQAVLGSAFVTAQLDVIQNIDEVKNPVKLAMTQAGADRISRLYGLFVWLAPLLMVISVVQIFRERRAELSYFWVVCAFTLFLLMLQLRFHYFGSLALYIVPFWCLEEIRKLWPRMSWVVVALSGILIAGALVPTAQLHLFSRAAAGLDPDYSNTREIYPALARTCKDSPGLVLAGSDEGHYVRYHTDCSVIANNFRLTQQHAEKIRRMEHLYSLTPDAFLAEAPEVRYVIATLVGYYARQPDGTLEPTPEAILRRYNSPLSCDLLLADQDRVSPRFRRLMEVRFDDKLPFPIAKLYEILPADASGATPADAAN